MPASALVLVLMAAGAHAAWNVLAKTADGGATFVWLFTVAAAVLYVPVLGVALALDPGPVDLAAIGLMAGSGALHALYFVALQRGYREGDLSLVYPLARGTGPLLATFAAIVALGERPSALALLGGAIIVAAVLSLALRGHARAGDARRAVGFALLTGVAIAGYTLWDKQAVGAHGISPVVYYWGTNLAEGLLLTPFVLHRGPELRRTWRAHRRQALGVAVLSPLAYILVLFALARAPVSYVAPARELSILAGAVLGTTVLSEGDRRRRLLAAAAICAGVAALALG
ncbi:MAG TPA: DMT family transporter [Solirubrobacteraceae bacterium]|nr:DMT family transporter [Solirubrobacteraceae bacterium]